MFPVLSLESDSQESDLPKCNNQDNHKKHDRANNHDEIENLSLEGSQPLLGLIG